MLRVIATVDKGMTDKPMVCVFPWEIPLLEVIHGDGSVLVQEIDDLTDFGAKAIVQRIKLKHTEEHAPDLRQQLINFCNELPDGIEPFDDPRSEYDRMANVYGMHPEVKQSIVENVYGRYDSGNFAKMVRSVADAHNAEEVESEGGTGKADPDAVDGMSGADVREALAKREVSFKNNDAVVGLKRRLKVILKLEDEGLVFNVNDDIEKLEELAGFVAEPE
jgi:hypothetical protein